ncbi:kinase-like domain-containing protein [Coniochaeta sp. 2T2.1]|nr:kinase-like domain-containing protein [Coniochaeta sp. 2T2.1]
MAPLSTAEEDALPSELLRQLSQTPYACSSLTQLSGGSANFVYRGILTQPLASTSGQKAVEKTVIVKHSTGFLSVNRDFALDVSRCLLIFAFLSLQTYEEFMLQALVNFTFTTPATLVRAPRLYLFIRGTNTQVHQDFSDATDLRAVLRSTPTLDNMLSSQFPSPISLGRSLGSWLRAFHTWASDPAQAALQERIGQNEPMRKLKHLVNYGTFIGILQKFPDIVSIEELKVLHDVKDMADKELAKKPRDGGECFGIIHGDFCMLNVLVSNNSKRKHQEEGEVEKLYIIDWELAQFGHRAYDLGHMIGDLYEQKHFNNTESAMPSIRGFVEGYGGLSEELAFRTAIHAGTHLIGGYNRRPKTGKLAAPEEKIVGMLEVAKDFVVKGWEKDRRWFESSPLAPLFRDN